MAADGFHVDFDLAQATGEPAFTVDLDGFEGPLDLLLELARRQRVDLARISILALAEQYLRFVEAARSTTPTSWQQSARLSAAAAGASVLVCGRNVPLSLPEGLHFTLIAVDGR